MNKHFTLASLLFAMLISSAAHAADAGLSVQFAKSLLLNFSIFTWLRNRSNRRRYALHFFNCR